MDRLFGGRCFNGFIASPVQYTIIVFPDLFIRWREFRIKLSNGGGVKYHPSVLLSVANVCKRNCHAKEKNVSSSCGCPPYAAKDGTPDGDQHYIELHPGAGSGAGREHCQ